MTKTMERRGMTRRELLTRSAAVTAALMIGPNLVAGVSGAWAMEVSHVSPQTMATLIQMARDIYPHDHVADDYYAVAVKSYDNADQAAMIEEGIASLNSAAQGLGHGSYLDTGWERDRVDILRRMEASPFFQTIRGGLVTGLYNQKAVWPLFGYEGESYSKGGYIDRGFDDINWI
ncbi:twin-arginine translocation signal domain-containing protein [Labrenzia sp. CE80]|uniref:twin-arginine translocation signal domain-containing protein n=1 Tax=Labrenzia sp. CE80 TaxID=1788986 RepID=UPI00129ADAD6|nr:twin-arginine translocation signal domain-containing protein [Labrenzia sp. CE80]